MDLKCNERLTFLFDCVCKPSNCEARRKLVKESQMKNKKKLSGI